MFFVGVLSHTTTCILRIKGILKSLPFLSIYDVDYKKLADEIAKIIVINASHSRTASETNIGNRVVACNTQNRLEAKFMGNMKKPTKKQLKVDSFGLRV